MCTCVSGQASNRCLLNEVEWHAYFVGPFSHAHRGGGHLILQTRDVGTIVTQQYFPHQDLVPVISPGEINSSPKTFFYVSILLGEAKH